ncbi:MAG: hypothetical protein V7706_14620 [Dietzia psychralcaliphila]
MPATTRTLTATALAAGLLAAGAPAASALNTDSLMPPPTDCNQAQTVRDETPDGWTAGDVGNICGELGHLVLEAGSEAEDAEAGTSRVLLFHRGERVATQPPDAARIDLGQRSNYHVELLVRQADEGDPAVSTVYVWNPFAGDGDATPIGPLPPGWRLP